MQDGSRAVVFVNNGEPSVDVSCDADCFKKCVSWVVPWRGKDLVR